MPRSYGRNERVAAAILREIADVLHNELKDPRVKNATVTEVKVTSDLRNARIYISFLTDSQEEIDKAMEGLNSSKGFIRSTLAIIGAITLLELGYVKKKTLYFIYGVETFVAATLDLLVINVFKNSGIEDVYNLFIIIAGSVAIYYIIRAFVINITYKNVDDTEKK